MAVLCLSVARLPKSLNQSVHNETREKAFKLVKAVLMANFLSMEDGVSYNFVLISFDISGVVKEEVVI